MTRRRIWTVVAVVVALGVLFVGVFPTRTWLAQRRGRQEAVARLHDLAAENRKLEARVRALYTDAEIERLAREQYDLVRPGEEAYAILPSRPATRPTPRSEAKDEDHRHRGLWARIMSIF